MAGYYKNPEATAEASAHGWHHTGDIGYLDDDGFLFIVDRAKDMIITGGFNVYSTEVEQALMAAPRRAGLRRDRAARREVGRAGRPPSSSCSRAATVDAAELIGRSSRSGIGSVKAPKQVEVWPDLPRSQGRQGAQDRHPRQLLRLDTPTTRERSRSASSASSACHTAGRGTDRMLRVSVGISATGRPGRR